VRCPLRGGRRTPFILGDATKLDDAFSSSDPEAIPRRCSGAMGIAAVLYLPAILVRAIADLGMQDVPHRSARAMLREQPRHRQPPGAITPTAADFDHLRTAFGYIAQGDHVARHGRMQHNKKWPPWLPRAA
jgi:hypothetical protein